MTIKKNIMIAVSALAIGASAPAFAENQQGEDKTIGQKIEKGWNETTERVSDAAESASEATKEAYDNVKNAIVGNDGKLQVSELEIDNRMLASGIIGQPVYNTDDERVAKVRDIILDRDGNAIMVILADGDFTGLGKTVAYDYQTLIRRTNDGEVIANITEEMIDQAAAFSYDRSDYSETVRVIPSNGFSVAELLGTSVTDSNGEVLAEVENIFFSKGGANQVIVEFNQTLGFGGEQVAINYGDLALVREEEELNFQMNAAQAQEFKAYKAIITN